MKLHRFAPQQDEAQAAEDRTIALRREAVLQALRLNAGGLHMIRLRQVTGLGVSTLGLVVRQLEHGGYLRVNGLSVARLTEAGQKLCTCAPQTGSASSLHAPPTRRETPEEAP